MAISEKQINTLVLNTHGSEGLIRVNVDGYIGNIDLTFGDLGLYLKEHEAILAGNKDEITISNEDLAAINLLINIASNIQDDGNLILLSCNTGGLTLGDQFLLNLSAVLGNRINIYASADYLHDGLHIYYQETTKEAYRRMTNKQTGQVTELYKDVIKKHHYFTSFEVNLNMCGNIEGWKGVTKGSNKVSNYPNGLVLHGTGDEPFSFSGNLDTCTPKRD